MTAAESKIDGRTKAGRAARAAAQVVPQGAPIDREAAPEIVTRRQPSRAAARFGIRDEPRAESRPQRAARSEVLGRNGEVLTRKRTADGDPFHIPPEMIEKGWEYQWISVSVVGNTDIVLDQNLNMLENGWRPVPASRFPGRFMPTGTAPGTHIVRGGQGLYERPAELCQQARNEDVAIAKQLISDRNDSLKLSGVKKALPDGFAMNGKYRGTGGDMRMSIDPALDIPMPQHQLAEPGE